MRSGVKIAMLIPNYGFGGAQKAFADHSLLLKEYGTVTEYVFNDWTEKRLYNTGNPYYSLDVPGGGGIVGYVKHLWQRVARFREYKKKLPPDITISFLEGADYINILSGGKDKKIIVIQGSKVGDKNISGVLGAVRHKILMPWLYKKADGIVTVSKDIKQEMIHAYGIRADKIKVVPNYFDGADIDKRMVAAVPDKLALLFSSGSFKLITFARLAAQKNLGVLFPVFDALKRRGLNVQLYIIGDGELREPLLQRATGSGAVWDIWSGAAPDAGKDIFFLGYQASPHSFLKLAHLYLMPSLWEGSPLALCEAMGSGIPVAAADCPTGPREILDTEQDRNKPFGMLPAGCLLPMITDESDREHIAAWADTIQQVMNNKGRLNAMRQNALERAKAYEKTVVGPQWLSAYLQE